MRKLLTINGESLLKSKNPEKQPTKYQGFSGAFHAKARDEEWSGAFRGVNNRKLRFKFTMLDVFISLPN
jgi:hypothetical protein